MNHYLEFLSTWRRFTKVSTNTLVKFLGDKSLTYEDRDKIISVIADKLSDENFKKKFIDKFGWKVGLRGVDLDKLIHITYRERRFYLETNKLRILFYTTYPKHDGEYPVYSAYQALYEIPELLPQWKEEYLTYRKQKREEYKESKEYKNILSIREQAKQEKKELSKFWKSLPKEEGLTLEIAFYLRLANHWAKTDGVKRETTLKFYEIKNKFVNLLQYSKLAKLYFYRPEYPDKYLHSKHYSYDYDFDEEFEDDDCCVIKDYYSLYYLEIKYEDMKFSFHTPYPIGKEFFPKHYTLPKIDHSEEESYYGFRFGRGMFEDEKIMFTKDHVVRRLSRLLPQAQEMWKK